MLLRLGESTTSVFEADIIIYNCYRSPPHDMSHVHPRRKSRQNFHLVNRLSSAIATYSSRRWNIVWLG